jgi:hypothetical protein
VLDSADQQNQSPFFQRLPPELRLAMYTFILQSQNVHILIREGTTSVISPHFPSPVESRRLMLRAVPCAKPNHKSCFDVTKKHPNFCPCPKPAIGGLFRACRLLYAESVSLLYTNTSFVFNHPRAFNELCKAITTNQQFTTSPLRFVRDMRIYVTLFSLQHYPEHIRDLNSGLTLLTEHAVTLKRFDLIVQTHFVVTQADFWDGETNRLLKKTLRNLGSFRGLETFKLLLPLSQYVGHLLDENKTSVAQTILRELVYLPEGSRTMTVWQFDNHFKTRYQALMARKRARGEGSY